jgi:uncharacterized protein (TIGR02118 family)
MITYTVYYPYKKDSFFDMDYYCNKHIPIARNYFGVACKGIMVLKGNSENGKQPRYACMCHLFFNTKKDFFEASEKSNAELIEDIKNFTDIEPVAEISEVSLQD